MSVSSVHHGSNAVLIAAVARLYARPGMTIIDVTYGRGAFWKQAGTSQYRLVTLDIQRPAMLRGDFTALPLRDSCADIVVFDPPYAHNPGSLHCDRTYNNAATSRGMYHKDIIERFYRAGMTEAARVLKPGGQLWVKCKDEVESGHQQWSHIEVHGIGESLGMPMRDLFILVPATPVNSGRWARQLHARKSHSYLLVFDHPLH